MHIIIFIKLQGFYRIAFRHAEAGLSEAPLAIFKDGSVLDLSPEATRWGVAEGNSKSLARHRCPGLVCVEHNPDLCAELFTRVWSEFARLTPQVEPVDFHQGFLDLTGCLPRNASVEDVVNASLLRLRFETGVEGVWGGGQNKWIAKLASGKGWVSPFDENDFLNHVSIQRLGLDESLCERLQRYGILSVENLFKTPRAFLQSHLQLTSKELQPLFQKDTSPVRALFPPPVLYAETDPLWDHDGVIEQAIHALSEEAAQKLLECRQQCGFLRVTLRTTSREQVHSIKLAKPIRRADTFESALSRLITEDQTRNLRRISLSLENLSFAPQSQGALWQNSSRDRLIEQIEKARSILDKKYGHLTIQSGRDFVRQAPPRFAQLIYARRGIYLP